MAGWSMLKNGCCLGSADINHGFKGGSSSLSSASDFNKDENDDNEIKLRCLFDQVLSVFANQASSMGCIRPMPALLGNGKSLDLLELFRTVRKRGGFDLVNGFWSFVVKELGLDLQASTSVKLVYFKYLYELERWLIGSYGDGRSQNEENMELETQFRSLSWQETQKRKDGLCQKNGKNNSKIGSSDTKHGNDDDHVVILDPSIGREVFSSRKRKRESVSEMLNWLVQIAKCPDDLSVGELPEISKWKDHKGDELWAQAIRARDALLQKRMIDSKSDQHNQKMHPSMYEDVSPLVDQSTERLRCSERLPALMKPRFCSCCNSCPGQPQSQPVDPPKEEIEKKPPPEEQPLVVDDSSAAKTPQSKSGGEYPLRHPSIGRRFQAEVPEWIDMVYETDPKWLGTRVCLPEYGGHDYAGKKYIRKRRPNMCDCQLPGSVECVRFHIAENRMKLKLELGPVFYQWRFDRMGEEISLRWTAAEEKRFKDMVRLNPPSLDKNFWDYSNKYFPKKTRDELVSYYFNVFLVQRRSYQNRVTPKHIDSDDDESEFGSLGDSFGNRAIKVLGSDILICSENKQCTDFTYT